MRFSSTASCLLGAFAAVAASEVTPPSSVVPGRFIVELPDSSAVSRALELAQGSESGLVVFKTFDSSIFKGISIGCEASSPECDPEKLRSLLETDARTTVSAVRPATRMRLIEPVEATDVEILADDGAAANYSVHGNTGVGKLHAAGIYGAGVTVAIVDSGVQYTHPALGGGLGEGYTVIGGHDFINGDDDPMDDYGHGTHVAGIIAGNSSQFMGVAPAAKILSYKTLGSDGFSDEELTIEGFLRAFDDGADIITASVGETSGFTTNTWAEIASRMVDEGAIITIAAGNAGQDGPFLMSNGASGRNVLTIASSEPDQMPARAFTAKLGGADDESPITMAYMPANTLFPNTVVDWPVVATSLDPTVAADACEPLPDTFGNLTGKVALVRYGGCSVSTKHSNLAPFDPEYLLFYSVADVYTTPNTGSSYPGLTGAIESAAGESLVSALASGQNVTLSFDLPQTPYVGLSNANGAGRPARYSTWGSTYDMYLKPDVAAPGSSILSTYPTDGYAVLSGTSMATPYVAGVAALLVSQLGSGRKNGNPAIAKQIEARIMASARSVDWADWSTSATDYGFWAPAPQVGAGLVDAAAALSMVTEVAFEGRKMEMNDTAHFRASHSVTLRNTGGVDGGGEAVTYGFTLEPAGGYEPWMPAPQDGSEPDYGVPGIKLYPEILPLEMVPGVVLPENATLAAGEEREFSFVFEAPAGLNASTLPVYSGKVMVSASNGEQLSIPYFGVGADLQAAIPEVWDTGAYFPYIVSGVNDIRLDSKANFTFNLSMSSQDFPQLTTRLAWGTEELRWDIFDSNYTEADWVYPPVPGANGFIGSATSWNGTGSSGWFDPEKDDEDDIFSFPIFDVPRDLQSIYFWLGRYADGSEVIPGTYKFRIAALAPLGNPQMAEDWHIWDTPLIKFL